MVARAISRDRRFCGIRPLDPLRDVTAVVRLIDEAFGPELNPMAQQTLRSLRWLSRTAWLLGPFLWLTSFAELLHGFVWVEGQQVVGNVTLSPSRGGGPGCWLISNVVVHHAYRGRGIERALMEEALSHIRSRSGHRVILQVRTDNPAALHLYGDMRFVAVDTLLEMRLPPERSTQDVLASAPLPTLEAQGMSLPLRRRGYDEWYQEYLLGREAVPAAAQRMHSVQRSKFRVPWDERILRWFTNRLGSVREYRLGIGEEGALGATLTVWAGRWRSFHRFEIMVHPHYRGQWEDRLVDCALAILYRCPARPIYIEVYAVHEALVRALQARGFVTDRELMQMELDLGNELRSG